MRVIPVIDIMGKLVVHAEYGKREKYRPLKSFLCKTSSPMDLALALKSNFGFNELYIADLDSILGRSQNIEILRQISELGGLEVMVDSGINNVLKVKELFQVGISKIVVGTETLKSIENLKDILEFAGYENVVVSIDILNKKIFSKCKSIARLSPKSFTKKLESIGVEEVIVLDLSKVGSGSGVNIELSKKVVNSVSVPVIFGGGIKSIEDIIELQKCCISGVLISTALHTLKITKKDLMGL